MNADLLNDDLFSMIVFGMLITIIVATAMLLLYITLCIDNMYLTKQAKKARNIERISELQSMRAPRQPAPYKTDDESKEIRREIEEYLISLHLELDRD